MARQGVESYLGLPPIRTSTFRNLPPLTTPMAERLEHWQARQGVVSSGQSAIVCPTWWETEDPKLMVDWDLDHITKFKEEFKETETILMEYIRMEKERDYPDQGILCCLEIDLNKTRILISRAHTREEEKKEEVFGDIKNAAN
jgi:hypothetical protein